MAKQTLITEELHGHTIAICRKSGWLGSRTVAIVSYPDRKEVIPGIRALASDTVYRTYRVSPRTFSSVKKLEKEAHAAKPDFIKTLTAFTGIENKSVVMNAANRSAVYSRAAKLLKQYKPT